MTQPSGPAHPLRVLLVNAPFGLIEYPHLGVSLLKAAVVEAGFACDVFYATVEFAQRIGFGNYRALESSASPLLLPERVFARALSERVPPLDAYYDACVRHFRSTALVLFGDSPRGNNFDRDNILRFERMAIEYCDEVASRPELGTYDVVGFTSSFGQHTASLALARRLKEKHPHLVVCVGGANAEGIMGRQLVRSFPFVDYAFSGDGDVAFPRFLHALAAGRPVDLPGVHAAADSREQTAETAPLSRANLDELPYPDFTDFFAAYEHVPEGRSSIRAIPIESARGCWWGEKHHCTFCGLNGMTMQYRSKSPQRFVDELAYLVERYGERHVMVTDNILDMKYLKTVVPMLKERRSHEVLFWEVKSNLSRRDLQDMAEAGITEIQPGVESLSTHVLELIDKGVTALQNVQLLKWAEELGITVIWMTLCGVPGESPEDYAAMADLMEKIPHLQPCRGFSRVTIDRFAPYFKWPERYGITIHPAPAYAYVYDLPADEIQNLAFWFYYDCANGSSRLSMEAPGYCKRALQLRTIWGSIYGRVRFCYHTADDGAVVLWDTRPGAAAEHVTLTPLESAVFLAADRVVTIVHVVRRLRDEPRWRDVGHDEVQAVLTDLEARRIVAHDAGHWLALANRATGRENRPVPAGGISKSYLWRNSEDSAERRA